MTRGDDHFGIASFFVFSANFFSCSSFHASKSRFASSVSKNAIIDFYCRLWQNIFGTLSTRRAPYTVAVASLTGTQILFAFPRRGEVMPMFVTWELLFLLAGFIIALLTYIDNHNKKN